MDYMWNINFGTQFRHSFQQLYSENIATMLVNDSITAETSLGQGKYKDLTYFCLSTLIIEILANVIRTGNRIKGIGHKEKVKISLCYCQVSDGKS